uniref:DUF5899 domain-containing protein n=1 Tax=viral metagenome TaxID=1070528 RepID=A0A6C0I947_9ZZZZ
MEIALTLVGGLTLFTLLNKKESFEETYFDSESYYRQDVSPQESKEINQFSPSESNILPGVLENSFLDYYNLSGDRQSEQEFIKKNNLYNNNQINGIPIKEYYEKYTKDTLDRGEWFLNKNMPQGTRQYQEDSMIQQRMEIFTGLQQKRDRETLGKPNKTEINNLFTPQEKTTGYGYQYGNGTGPGLALTRQKELEDYKQSVKFKTNEMPFEKIQVGRGIALGTEVPAAGGFQQYTRIVPDNISNYSANQLPGRVAGGKWAVSNAPTSQQPVLKNRPNGYYSLCQRGPAAGKAVMTAELIRPDYDVILKNQNRTVINYGFGAPLQNLDSFLCSSN